MGAGRVEGAIRASAPGVSAGASMMEVSATAISSSEDSDIGASAIGVSAT